MRECGPSSRSGVRNILRSNQTQCCPGPRHYRYDGARPETAAWQRKRPSLVKVLRQWVDEKRRWIFRGSLTIGPITYAFSQWPGLIAFLEDGRIGIDNNPVERSIRPIALQKKECTVRRPPARCGERAAIASLVETCKLLAINPNADLADVLARIVGRADGNPLDDLLPGQRAIRRR